MERTVAAYVGLGANLGATGDALRLAVRALGALPGVSLTGVSRLYRTRPVGPVQQADFLNAVAALRVPSGPVPTDGAMALLVALKGIERAMGRRPRQRWGPREIDLDLLVFGPHHLRVERVSAARSEDPAGPGPQWLEVPHPMARERLFVLAPLADLAPRLRPPGWGETVARARERALEAESEDAVRAVADWDTVAGDWREA